MIEMIITYYVEILLSIITGLFVHLRRLWTAQKKINKAQTEGLQALLRSSLIGYYTRAMENGYLVVYQRDTINKLYDCYCDLDGNGTIVKLYNDMMSLPVLHKVPPQPYYRMNEDDKANVVRESEL